MAVEFTAQLQFTAVFYVSDEKLFRWLFPGRFYGALHELCGIGCCEGGACVLPANAQCSTTVAANKIILAGAYAEFCPSHGGAAFFLYIVNSSGICDI